MQEEFNEVNTAEDVRSLLLFSKLNGDDPETLRKRIRAGFEVTQVKQNPKRKVYRLDCPDGTAMYLKLFARQGVLNRCFRFYASCEYQAARQLSSLGLPVIRYLAWGRLRQGGGFCLSEGVPAAVQARRYFFETLTVRPELKADFLALLAETTLLLVRSRICHPDFHLGNILYSQSEKTIFLPDPWGVRQCWLWRKHHLELLCLPWLEMSGSLSGDELLTGLQKAGLAQDPGSARALLDRTAASYERRRSRHWKKLTRRILSGRSKYATEVELPSGRCAFRHTEWFELPEKLELDPAWIKSEFATEADSRDIWLDSFLQIPPVENPPVARLVRPDGSSALFYQPETHQG